MRAVVGTMINRNLEDMAEEIFLKIIEAEINKPQQVRAMHEGDIIGYAQAAKRIADTYFNYAYGE